MTCTTPSGYTVFQLFNGDTSDESIIARFVTATDGCSTQTKKWLQMGTIELDPLRTDVVAALIASVRTILTRPLILP